MRQLVSFQKLKLTNNHLDPFGHVSTCKEVELGCEAFSSFFRTCPYRVSFRDYLLKKCIKLKKARYWGGQVGFFLQMQVEGREKIV